MKAITLWQPWASLIACGAKKYETRSWQTTYRGPIAIHAAAKKPSSIWGVLEKITNKVCIVLGIWDPDELPRGSIIATAELVECWQIQPSNGQGVNFKDVFIRKRDPRGLDGFTWIDGDELVFGNWTPGRYAWELQNVVVLPEPIPAKGAQGLWNWNEKEALPCASGG